VSTPPTAPQAPHAPQAPGNDATQAQINSYLMQKLAHQGDQLAYQQQFNAYQQQFNAWAHAKFGAVEWDLSEIHNKFNMREAVEESVGPLVQDN
jgi:hypothetical protein